MRDPAWRGPSARTLARRYGGLDGAWQALAPVPAEVVPIEVLLVRAARAGGAWVDRSLERAEPPHGRLHTAS